MKKALRPSQTSAPRYPTVGEARRKRRVLIASLGAAALGATAAAACAPFATSGEYASPELTDGGPDAGLDGSLDSGADANTIGVDGPMGGAPPFDNGDL